MRSEDKDEKIEKLRKRVEELEDNQYSPPSPQEFASRLSEMEVGRRTILSAMAAGSLPVLLSKVASGQTNEPDAAFEDRASLMSGTSVLSDLGTDTDGGDNYGFPSANDNLDLQGDGRIKDADAVITDTAQIGTGTSYPMVANDKVKVTVDSGGGADYQSIQAAVDDVPKHNRKDYVIGVNDGHDESVGGNGHVKLRAHHQEGFTSGDYANIGTGQNSIFQIMGNPSDPSKCKVETLTIVGCQGVATPKIDGVSFSNKRSPDVNENAAVVISGSGEGGIFHSEFRDTGGTAESAIVVYGSRAQLRDVNFGQDIFKHAVQGKRQARPQPRSTSGSVTGAAFKSIEGSRFFQDNRGGTVSGGNGRYTASYGGQYLLGKNDDVTYHQNPQQMAELGTDMTTPTSVNSDRDYRTKYTNNTNHNRMVAIYLNSDGSQNIAAGLKFAGSDGGSLESISFDRIQSADMSGRTQISFGPLEVPPGGSYYLGEDTDVNEASINVWREWHKA